MKAARPRSTSFVAASALALALSAGAHGVGVSPQQGLRFDSPDVLDLAERAQKIASGNPVAIVALPAPDAEKILAAATLAEDPPPLQFSDDVYGCKPASDACSRSHESGLIAASGGAVKRDAARLIVTPANGAPLVFADWKKGGSKTAEGDEENHWYLGPLAGSGYQRVEVQFGHDAPGNFLINPQSGKVAFVHNGADLVAPSPDGLHLLTFNALNPPLSLRIAALNGSGPRLALQCEASRGGDRVSAGFTGWNDVHSVDLILEIRAARSKLAQRIALRLTRAGADWTVASNAPERLREIGFACTSAVAAAQ